MTQPPTLNYNTPDPKGNPNSPGRFILRMLLGATLGVVACIVGFFLLFATNGAFPPLFFLPPALVLAGAIAYAVRQRRYGIATGVIVGPIIVTLGLGVMLFIACSGMRF